MSHPPLEVHSLPMKSGGVLHWQDYYLAADVKPLLAQVEELETQLGKAKAVNYAHQQDAIKHRAKIESLERHVSTLEKELFKPDSAEVERGK